MQHLACCMGVECSVTNKDRVHPEVPTCFQTMRKKKHHSHYKSCDEIGQNVKIFILFYHRFSQAHYKPEPGFIAKQVFGSYNKVCLF